MDRTLTLHFIDGSKLTFEFPRQGANAAARKLKLEEFLASQHLVIEAEGSLLVFPVANIKYVAITAPMLESEGGVALARNVITGARILS
jgi:hypothetical protein